MERFRSEINPFQEWFPPCHGSSSYSSRRNNHVTQDLAQDSTTTSGSSTVPLLYKASCSALAMVVLIWGHVDAGKYRRSYFAYFSHWAVLVTWFYFSASLWDSWLTRHYSYENNDESWTSNPPTTHRTATVASTSLSHKTSWLLLELAIHSSILSTLGFWTGVPINGLGEIDFLTLAVHGILLILALVDGWCCYAADKPFRWMHWTGLILPFDFLYLVWSLIHGFANVENPDKLYAQVQWQDKTVITICACLSALAVSFVVFALLWYCNHFCHLFSCCSSKALISEHDTDDNSNDADVEAAATAQDK